MTEQFPNSNELTPQQAADVIRYYYIAENLNAIRFRRRRPETALGLVALHTTQPRHSILPDKAPLLTDSEMNAGLSYLNDNPDYLNPPDPTTPPDKPMSPEQEAKVDREVDVNMRDYDEARRRVLDD